MCNLVEIQEDFAHRFSLDLTSAIRMIYNDIEVYFKFANHFEGSNVVILGTPIKIY